MKKTLTLCMLVLSIVCYQILAYNVTCTTPNLSTNPTSGKSDELITLTYEIENPWDYTYVWSSTQEVSFSGSDNMASFNMPMSDISVSVTATKKTYNVTCGENITAVPTSGQSGDIITVTYDISKLEYDYKFYSFNWSSEPEVEFTADTQLPYKAIFAMPIGDVSVSCEPVLKEIALNLTGPDTIANDTTAKYVLTATILGYEEPIEIKDATITASSDDYVDINGYKTDGYEVDNQNITRESQSVTLTATWQYGKSTKTATISVTLTEMPYNAIGLKKNWNLLGLLANPTKASARDLNKEFKDIFTGLEKKAYRITNFSAGEAFWVFSPKRQVVTFKAKEEEPILPPEVEVKERTLKMLMVITGNEEWLNSAKNIWKWNDTSFENTEKEDVKIGEAYWVSF